MRENKVTEIHRFHRQPAELRQLRLLHPRQRQGGVDVVAAASRPTRDRDASRARAIHQHSEIGGAVVLPSPTLKLSPAPGPTNNWGEHTSELDHRYGVHGKEGSSLSTVAM